MDEPKESSSEGAGGRAGEDVSETEELLRRARTTILNLRAVAQKTARYNTATRDDMLGTIEALNAALGLSASNREFQR